jgi:rod shape-determining protein MreD
MHALAVALLGIAGLVVQGGLSSLLPAGLAPDLGLLVVVGAGLCLPAASGFCVSAIIGYAADLLSGSLLGAHALVRVLCYGAARLSNRRLHLGRGLPLAVFVLGATLVSGGALLGLGRMFGEPLPFDLASARVLALHACVNALLASPVIGCVEALVRRLHGDDLPRAAAPWRRAT